jgi:glucosamine--fructose-6-phosphate aminotransferase (isomerizing)
MCGIFGYVGERQEKVAEKAYHALCDLEYRGYDSWGIAWVDKDALRYERSVGKISDRRPEDFASAVGKMSLGHSRWATHGGVAEKNAHPQLSYDNKVAVIHNGIIENHEALRKLLVERTGKSEEELFRSETDTEVVPNRESLDQTIERFAENWEIKRMAYVDRNILRLGTYELLHIEEIPVKVAINEAVELAKRYGEPDSSKFVNGILDKIAKTESRKPS